MIGKSVGPYQVLSKLGEGGMGEVYRARDSKLKRDVAIKVLPASVAADPARLARFQREAEVLASLNHPHIAAVYGFEDGPTPALVMELVEGPTLADRIAQGPIGVADVLPIARQVADALEAAHDQGIIHRDLKPENIKVRLDGVVKVLDFGLAKALAPEGARGTAEALDAATITSPAMTDVGVILGTAAYMAPEQARGRVVDRRADIWAFGVVVIEMLTGRRLFRGEDVTDTIISVVSKDPDWTSLPAETPAALRRVLARCLKKDPKVRLRDIGEARIEIDALLGGADDASGTAPVVTPTASVALRSRGLTWALAASTLALGVVALLLWAPWRAPAPPQVPDWAFSRKTFVAQAISSARFMPGSQNIVFSSALAGSVPGLFELRPDSVAPRAFGPPGTHLLSVSTSGELAVLTGVMRLGPVMEGTLARMAIDGTARALADDVHAADWLPDGSDLAVARTVPGGDQLEFPKGQVVHRTTGYVSDLRVSPDGTRVAFMDHPIRDDNRGWVKVVDRAGTVSTLAGEYSQEQGVAWSADSRTVFFATTRINSVPAAGGAVTTLTSVPGTVYLLDAAADGRLMVAREDSRVGVVAKGAGQETERELSTRQLDWGPSLSPDGTLAVFTQAGAPDYFVVMRAADGRPPSRLGPGNVWAFSPDQRWVTASLPSSGRCAVYPTGPGQEVSIEMGPLESCLAAGWFPDGKHLVVVGRERGQPVRTYRVAFPGGTPQLLLGEDLTPQGLRSSGGCLLASDAAGGWRRFDANGPSTAVAGLRRTDHLLDCAPGRPVIVGDNTVVPALVYRVDLVTGRRTRIDEVAPVERAGILAVQLTVYRDNGQYAYEYTRGATTLYVATPRQ